jgi:hypothetical protein
MHIAGLLLLGLAVIAAWGLLSERRRKRRIQRDRLLHGGPQRPWGTQSDRLEEMLALAQNDGRWDDPKRRGEAVKSAEAWQRELDELDRNRRAR